MKERILGALLLIGCGLLLFIKNAGWLPEALGFTIARAFEKYWPVLIILAGLRVLVRKSSPGWAYWLGWLIVLLAAVGLYCWLTASREWVI